MDFITLQILEFRKKNRLFQNRKNLVHLLFAFENCKLLSQISFFENYIHREVLKYFQISSFLEILTQNVM